MAVVSREVREGLQLQGEDEQIAYTITTTPWGASPSSVTVVVKDETANFDVVTTSVTTGTVSVVGDVITTPIIKNLMIRHTYRVEVLFTAGSNVYECYFRLRGER